MGLGAAVGCRAMVAVETGVDVRVGSGEATGDTVDDAVGRRVIAESTVDSGLAGDARSVADC